MAVNNSKCDIENYPLPSARGWRDALKPNMHFKKKGCRYSTLQLPGQINKTTGFPLTVLGLVAVRSFCGHRFENGGRPNSRYGLDAVAGRKKSVVKRCRVLETRNDPSCVHSYRVCRDQSFSRKGGIHL